MNAPARPSEGGFTLIEVLVSVFLMAVLSALAFEALNYVRRSREVTQSAYARLGAVELTVHLLVNDFAQAAPRPIRDSVGTSTVPALLADSGLACDPRGCVQVGPTLESVSHPALRSSTDPRLPQGLHAPHA